MKEKLKELKLRIEKLKPIVSKGFEPFTGEFEKYVEKNKSIFEEYYEIREKIEEIEYNLMTDEEKKENDEYESLLKLKVSGKFKI